MARLPSHKYRDTPNTSRHYSDHEAEGISQKFRDDQRQNAEDARLARVNAAINLDLSQEKNEQRIDEMQRE